MSNYIVFQQFPVLQMFPYPVDTKSDFLKMASVEFSYQIFFGHIVFLLFEVVIYS
jgi:hypothetical protein